MNIAVLAGGTSSEREISIVSGTQVAHALRSRGHQVFLADVFGGFEDIQAEEAFSREQDIEQAVAYMHGFDEKISEIRSNRRSLIGPGILDLCLRADAVFLALHGSNGEDGRLQAAFDLLGITYTGSNYLGSALAMDKETSKQLFRENRVPTPEGFVLRRTDEILPPDQNGVGLPCVVKPSCGGSSVGVSIAWRPQEYAAALEAAFGYEEVLIVEHYIEGREFSVGMVDGEAYPVIEIAPLEGFYDYVNKYKPGSTIETCPAQISPELTVKMQQAALAACKALRLDSYGRVDIMMDKNENIYCLEANSLPGMTPTSLLPQEAQAKGLDFPALCEKLVMVSLKRKPFET